MALATSTAAGARRGARSRDPKGRELTSGQVGSGITGVDRVVSGVSLVTFQGAGPSVARVRIENPAASREVD
jgi:hypothetical protein